MKLPWTLSRYIGKYFILYILLAVFGLTAITSLIDIVEMIRRAAGRDGAPFHIILSMTLLKIPGFIIKLMPYAVLIGSMMSLSRLTRSQELIVARAAGVSVWQFLYPAIIIVFIIGVFITTALNPFAAALMTRNEIIEAKYITGRTNQMAVSASGLWLRQIEDIDKSNKKNNVGENIIYAEKMLQNDMSFSHVIVFTFDKNKKFTERLDAARAILENSELRLSDVVRSLPGKPPEKLKEYSLHTSLTPEHIQDSFASPETISFWHLPSFIGTLENAGFSALKHKIYWQSLLSNPFLMVGTMLIAAVFSLRLPRRGKIGILIVAGVLAGFLIHFFTDIIFAFGAAGTIPTALAAWTPALIANMIGISLLLHLEDG